MNKSLSIVAILALLSVGANAANMKYAEEESGSESTYEEEAPAAATGSSKVNEVSVLVGSATYGLGLGINYHRDLSAVTGKAGPGSIGVELGVNLDLGEDIGYYSYSVTNINVLATYKYAIDQHMSAKIKMGLAYSIYNWAYSGPSNSFINNYDLSESGIYLAYGASFDYKVDDTIGTFGVAYYAGGWSNVIGVTYTYGF